MILSNVVYRLFLVLHVGAQYLLVHATKTRYCGLRPSAFKRLLSVSFIAVDRRLTNAVTRLTPEVPVSADINASAIVTPEIFGIIFRYIKTLLKTEEFKTKICQEHQHTQHRHLDMIKHSLRLHQVKS